MKLTKTSMGMLSAAVLWIAMQPSALAWSRQGHMISGALAYRSLSESAQTKYRELLAHHPDYGKWKGDYEEWAIDFDFGVFLFMRASLWPDEIRGKNNEHDHPTWHYTNYPLRPYDFPPEETLTPANDVLHGIAQSEKTLSDSGASAVSKAVHVSWLIHLIGDLHQPLHCTALVTATYPEGDRGGNDFFVRVQPGGEGIRLHSLWDGLLGTSANVRDAWNETARLQAKYPRESLPELGEDSGARQWSLDGRQRAIEHVYLKGHLEGTTKERRAQAPILPAGYPQDAKRLAERLVALASYRLADRLERIL